MLIAIGSQAGGRAVAARSQANSGLVPVNSCTVIPEGSSLIVGQKSAEALCGFLRQVTDRMIAIVRIELLQRSVDPDRRVAGEREAMQCEQHLLAS